MSEREQILRALSGIVTIVKRHADLDGEMSDQLQALIVALYSVNEEESDDRLHELWSRAGDCMALPLWLNEASAMRE